jgi:uncharacterized glyoxalase superfamily protein PhnB
VTALLLAYTDVSDARDFFVTSLGFAEEWCVRDDGGAITRSHVRLGDTLLMLDQPGAHGVKSPRDVGGVTHMIVISVGDVDAHWRQAKASGLDLGAPPVDRPWGREYEVVDAEGYVFTFIT